jgi:hypothetical protein
MRITWKRMAVLLPQDVFRFLCSRKMLENLSRQLVCDLTIEPKPCRIGRCCGNNDVASAYVSAVICLSIYFIFPRSEYFPGHLGLP